MPASTESFRRATDPLAHLPDVLHVRDDDGCRRQRDSAGHRGVRAQHDRGGRLPVRDDGRHRRGRAAPRFPRRSARPQADDHPRSRALRRQLAACSPSATLSARSSRCWRVSGLGISVFKTGALALIGDISASTTSHTRFMNTVEGFFAVGAIVGPAVVATLIAQACRGNGCTCIAARDLRRARRDRQPRALSRADERSRRARQRCGRWSSVMKDPLALGFSAARDALRRGRSRDLCLDADVSAGLRRLVRLAAGVRADDLLRAARRGTIPRRMAARPRVLDGRAGVSACAIFLCFLGSLFVRRRSRGAGCCRCPGLFMSIMYPTLNSKGISCFPKSQHGAAAGVILFFTAAAAALGPLAMGAVSDAYGSDRGRLRAGDGLRLLAAGGLAVNWLLDPSRAACRARTARTSRAPQQRDRARSRPPVHE